MVGNETDTLNNERQEGDISSQGVLALNLSDDDVLANIGNRVSDSEKFWNAKLDLDRVRERNEKYWLNETISEDDLYDFQVPYKDNRIFVAIESLLPTALSKPAQPIVTPAHDTDASRELAENIQKILLAKYDDLYLHDKSLMVARHLLIGLRYGVMKYRWDDTIGRIKDGEHTGDIAVDVLRPQRVVIEQGSTDPDDIPLIGEYKTATVEELCYKFPKKKDEIYKQSGVTINKQTKQVGHMEVWFSYHDKANFEKKEAVAWKYGSVLCDKSNNLNYDYDNVSNNFFDRPRKPYVIFNHLNLGRWLVDDTSLSEQSQSLQDVLNKRGRQIVENADQANSGTIFNSELVSAETVSQLVGDPNEKVLVKGDVSKAAMRLPVNMLQPFVLQDKQDARDEIDNTFGTHDPIRGEDSGKRTLGQDVLSQRSDLSRISPLASSIESGMDRLYKGMLQLMKVFYDETQLIQYTGDDGKTTFTEFSQSSIEQGVKVRVKSGSMLPDDPAAQEAQTLKALPILDPLSIAEGLNKEDPKEFAKRMMYFKMFPDKYLTEVLNVDPSASNVDQDAASHIEMLNQGQMIEPEQNPSKEHLATHQAFMQDAQFQQLPTEVQQLHIQHVQAEIDNAKQALGQQGKGELEGDQNMPMEGMTNGEPNADMSMMQEG